MRRLVLLSLTVGGLAGCSGVGKFTRDTVTLPGANPNLPAGATETMDRVEARPVTEGALEPEGGNVWPGNPKPFPTLGEVEKETQNGQTDVPGASMGPAGAGIGAGTTASSSPGTNGVGTFKMQSNPDSASTITIPNGNGTSTVIAPDGSVRVIPTPGGSTSGAAAPPSGK